MWLSACGGGDPVGTGRPTTPPDDRKPLPPKEPDPEVQKECRGDADRRGDICKDSSSCKSICDDIFSSNKKKRACEDLSVKMVKEFENIFSILDDGDNLDDIKAGPLRCLLDISITEFRKEVDNLNKGEVRDFLAAIASQEELAEALKAEDDDYDILEELLEQLDDDTILSAFEDDIDDGDNLFELIVDANNEPAWKWIVEGYVSEKCENSTYCNTAQTEDNTDEEKRELVFFCKVYKTSKNVDDLLDHEPFEDDYKDTIEDLNKCGSDGESKCDYRHTDFLSSISTDNTVCKRLCGTACD